MDRYTDKFLMVPLQVIENINDILEDHFRIAFQFHSRGMLKANSELTQEDVVSDFMAEYEMDNYGFKMDSMIKILQRGKNNKLSKLQKKTTHKHRNFVSFNS
jgi:hypothetical protein